MSAWSLALLCLAVALLAAWRIQWRRSAPGRHRAQLTAPDWVAEMERWSSQMRELQEAMLRASGSVRQFAEAYQRMVERSRRGA